MKRVYTCFCTDVIHEGHRNIIREAGKYGELTIGVLSDAAMIRFNRFPTISFEERMQLVRDIPEVSNVVVQDDVMYDKVIEELRQLYPDLEPKCREHAICQKYGAVFIIGIGCKLSDGKKHDGRAPDYDDYTTKGLNDLPGLNGDLLLWDNVLQRSIELSSMGIRVDKEALQRQLKEEKEEKRLELYFHKRLMNDTLPLSIGGGIGQSRLCMFYLRKAHIGEIQASIWPEDMRKECEELDIHLI